MKAQKTLLENFSRYEFAADGTAKNKSTGSAIAIEANGSMRLTSDDGSRKRVYQSDVIKEVAKPGSTSAIAETSVKKSSNSVLVDTSDDDDDVKDSKLIVQTDKKAKAERTAKRREKTDPGQLVTNESKGRKLSVVDVAEIKRRIDDGDKNKDIASDYSVHSSTISDIKGGRLYKDVKAAV